MCNVKKWLTACPIGSRLLRLIHCKIKLAETWGMALFTLAARVWVAHVFFTSGLTKIISTKLFGIVPAFTLSDTTYFLFQYEYGYPTAWVPLLAWAATLMELIAPVFLALGIMGRFWAVGLLIMTAVIELTYQSHTTHYLWGSLLLLLALYGPGKFSVDTRLRRYFFDNQ